MKNIKPAFIYPVLILVGACATMQPFQPVDTTQVRGPGGYRAAVYDISGGRGNWDNIVVQVWTTGPSWEEKTKDNPNPRAFMDVQWHISNHSHEAVQLNVDQTKLLLPVQTSTGSYAAMAQPSPVVAVQPGSDNTLELSFPLPAGTKAEELASFEVAWIIASNNQNYGQTTRFERAQSKATIEPNFGIGFGVGL